MTTEELLQLAKENNYIQNEYNEYVKEIGPGLKLYLSLLLCTNEDYPYLWGRAVLKDCPVNEENKYSCSIDMIVTSKSLFKEYEELLITTINFLQNKIGNDMI